MKRTLIRMLLLVCSTILLGGASAVAEDFNPANPPEPQTLYRLKVQTSPAGVGLTSGSGRYQKGTRVYINTSVVDTDYTFKRWEKNGETISTSRSFYYTVGESDETLTAVYEFVVFDPSNPPEPSEVYKYTLSLVSDPEEGCSFNLDNGSKHLPGESFNITAYPNQGFVFEGWYNGEEKISDSYTIPFTMERCNAKLTARFSFIPESPEEPAGGDTPNVDNSVNYDINGDGIVNALDAANIIDFFLNSDIYIKKYDVNGDGLVNSLDTANDIYHFLTN